MACLEERPQVCGEIRLALAEVRWRTPLASMRGTPGGRRQGPSSMEPRQALLLHLLHRATLAPTHRATLPPNHLTGQRRRPPTHPVGNTVTHPRCARAGRPPGHPLTHRATPAPTHRATPPPSHPMGTTATHPPTGQLRHAPTHPPTSTANHPLPHRATASPSLPGLHGGGDPSVLDANYPPN